MSILVVGGTGSVGGDVVRKLGRRAAALARGGSAHRKAEILSRAGARVVDGDLTRPQTVLRACEGMEVVVSTATSMPTGADDGLRRVDHDGTLALIDAAARQGVRRFVYVSYSGNIREDSPLERAKRACEDRAMASSMTTVILRPSYFMEVWLGPHLGFDPANGTVRIYGSGERKVSYVWGPNVADFAVAAATREYTQKNTVVEIGGPQPLSQLEAVRVFEQALGKAIAVEHVPLEAVQSQRQSSNPVMQAFGALTVAYANGDEIPGAASLAAEYGIRLRSVAEYARPLAAPHA